jgi:transcriptional regulator with XRE-family HTH domain
MIHPLRKYRQRSHLSLFNLAEQCGTSAATISRIERGGQWPDRELMQRLIDATGGEVTFADFGEFQPEGSDAA